MSRSGAVLATALACLAVIGSSSANAGAGVTAAMADAGPARPTESGARDSAATLGPLAIGAPVSDRTGLEIGHVTRLTTGRDGRQVAEVRRNEDVFSIPVDQLYAHDGAAFSRETLDQLKHSGAAH